MSTCFRYYLCINSNKPVTKKTIIVFTASSIFGEASEVSKAVKLARETGDNCLGYGNDANPPVSLLLYPKTVFWF